MKSKDFKQYFFPERIFWYLFKLNYIFDMKTSSIEFLKFTKKWIKFYQELIFFFLLDLNLDKMGGLNLIIFYLFMTSSCCCTLLPVPLLNTSTLNFISWLFQQFIPNHLSWAFPSQLYPFQRITFLHFHPNSDNPS